MTPLNRRWQRWAWRAAGLVPAFILATFVANDSVPAGIRLEAVVVLVATMIRPAIGLMLLAWLAPLGDVLVPLLGVPPMHQAETVAIAFLAGWLSVLAAEDEPRSTAIVPPRLAGAMWIFGGVLVASVAATALQLHRENPANLYDTLALVARSYLLTDDQIGVHAAGHLLEGLGLVGAAAVVARRDPRDRFWVLLSLVASGVVAGIASGLLAMGIAPDGALARRIAVGLPRYSAISGDVNATASWYLLLIGVSVGVATSLRSARLQRPAQAGRYVVSEQAGRYVVSQTVFAWFLAAVIMLAGLTLTGSGAGVIGLVVLSAAGMWWLAGAVSRRGKLVGALVLVALVVVAIVFARSERSANSLEMRGGFTQASLRLIEARPVFGVGAGRYFALSILVLPNGLSWLYGRENAHDYYLQIAAELGLVGAIAFGWVLAAALGGPLRRVWRGRAEAVTVGCVAGVSAYLVSALTGHPFLVPETVIPFWIVLGLIAAQQVDPASRSPWRSRASIALACALVLSAPLRGDVTGARLSPADDGFGPWRTDDAGRQFREAGALGSLFVGPTITAVEIPMRLRGAGPASVNVWVPGTFGGELHVDGGWSTLLVRLPGAEALIPRQRINLALIPAQDGASTAGTRGLDVGQITLVSAK